MRGFVLAGALLAAVGASGCLESPRSTAQTTATEQPSWNILVMGDSDATGMGDATGLGWAERYARLVRQRVAAQAEAKVVVSNLARSGQTSGELVSAVLSDPPTQGALAEAQIVLIGIGGADLSAGDARLEAGTCTRAMALYRGRCVDVFSVFNGREGTQDAYAKGWLTTSPCCYPNAEGQQVIAELVLRTGLAEPS